MMMSGMARATLTNDGLDYSNITAVNMANSSGATILPNGQWWMDAFNISWVPDAWATSYAGISWDLVATKGSAYNFSGSNIQFNAMNAAFANGIKVQLLHDNMVVWESASQSLGSPKNYSFDVPVNSAYSDIDKIIFVFSSNDFRQTYEVNMNSFTSTASQVPEPGSILLLTSAIGLMASRRRK
jgi:hypothetical protein